MSLRYSTTSNFRTIWDKAAEALQELDETEADPAQWDEEVIAAENILDLKAA